MKSDVLLTRTGRGSRPPQHLADLDPAERRGVAVALGEPAYRAEQLSRHYFARLADDAATSTATAAPPARRCGGASTVYWSSRCSCATPTGRRCACPARPAAAWGVRSARPAREACGAASWCTST